MAVNLLRNTKVFFTTNVDEQGKVKTGASDSAFSSTNTFQLLVQDGFSFSQTTSTETVQLNESGSTPNRGQRSFNTALEPVEFSFSTYIRPYKETNVGCDDLVLWEALATGKGATSSLAEGTSSTSLDFSVSNRHQLEAFGMIIILDNTTYLIDNCALDQAQIDFGLDALAMITWTGRGTLIRKETTNWVASGGVFTAGPAANGGTGNGYSQPTATAPYIANKLSVVKLISGPNAAGAKSELPITGGSVTIANNLNYLTPANLGVVNTPVTYFTGTRAISGTLNAYLTGTAETILANLLDGVETEIDPGYNLELNIGGTSNSYVKLEMPAAMLSIPTINAEQVVSTTINFVAQASESTAYDITKSNELTVTYYAA